MQKLFENLLDCHPNFVHPQDKQKTSEKSVVKKIMTENALPRNSLVGRRKMQRNDQSPWMHIHFSLHMEVTHLVDYISVVT